MVNDILEKGFSVNHKIKNVNFPGGTRKKILRKVDDKIKEQPDDLLVHVGTNDLINNVFFSLINLLTNVKKILNKFSKESLSTSIAFSSIINRQKQDEHPESLTRYECPF